MLSRRFLSAVALLATLGRAAGEPVPTPTPVLDPMLVKIDFVRAPGASFGFDCRLTAYRNEAVTSVSEFTVHVRDSVKTLLRYTAPPTNAGRIILMMGDEMWVYVPSVHTAVPIRPDERMAGEASYADVLRVAYGFDYDVEEKAEETLDGHKAIRLRLKAKSRAAAHDLVNLWVERETHKPLKAELLAVSGTPLKVEYFKGYRQMLGRERPTVVEIQNLVDKGEKIILEYLEMRNEEYPDMYFRKEMLDQVR